MRTARSCVERSGVGRFGTLLIVLVIFAAGCAGSATVSETGSGSTAESTATARTTVEAVEPTAVPAESAAEVDEPTAAPAEATVEAVEPTAVPAVPAPEPLPLDSFRADNVVAISDGGRYAYAGTTSPWDVPTACGVTPSESLAVIEIDRAIAGEITPFAAGLEQAGDIRQMINGPGSSAAVLMSCGGPDDGESWLQRVEFGDDGRIASTGDVLALGADNESDPYLVSWVADESVEVRVLIEDDPDDVETWIIDRRQVSLVTGEILASEQFGFFDDEFGPRMTYQADGGFTYRTIEDPDGALGCEGFGVAQTIELETSGERRLALTQPGLVFSDVNDFHIAESGHVAWTSGCEGFVTAYVGKMLPDGRIADAHFVDLYTDPFEDYAEYRTYRLTNDGFLVAVGQSFDPDVEAGTLAFLRYDLNTDPNFVNTADPAPSIDPDPLLVALGGDGGWHVGETLSTDPSCGATTLYGQTPGGFVRAFSAAVELDTIVAMDAGETHVIEYDDGGSYVSRTVVVQTECPASHEGRRVWFGTESAQIVWGLSLSEADLGEVADVLSVRDVLQEGNQFIDYTVVEVELLDGTIAEVELVALPFDG